MALDKEQIKQLLGQGLSATVVATAVGCVPAYISQLLSDSKFAEEVSSLRTAALTANNKRDSSIDKIEDGLIGQLAEIVESKQFYKPADVLRAVAVVNNMKRRGVPASETLNINNTIVNITMPAAVRRKITINAVGEVIEADGQSLITMPSAALLSDLADQADKTQKSKVLENGGPETRNSAAPNKYREAARFLPAASSRGRG